MEYWLISISSLSQSGCTPALGFFYKAWIMAKYNSITLKLCRGWLYKFIDRINYGIWDSEKNEPRFAYREETVIMHDRLFHKINMTDIEQHCFPIEWKIPNITWQAGADTYFPASILMLMQVSVCLMLNGLKSTSCQNHITNLLTLFRHSSASWSRSREWISDEAWRVQRIYRGRQEA